MSRRLWWVCRPPDDRHYVPTLEFISDLGFGFRSDYGFGNWDLHVPASVVKRFTGFGLDVGYRQRVHITIRRADHGERALLMGRRELGYNDLGDPIIRYRFYDPRSGRQQVQICEEYASAMAIFDGPLPDEDLMPVRFVIRPHDSPTQKPYRQDEIAE